MKNDATPFEPAQAGSPAPEAGADDDMGRLEAVLFLAREPMNSRKISQLAGLADGTQARTLIRRLNAHYDQVGRSFHIKQIAGGYQLRTRPSFSMWLQRLQQATTRERLSPPAMETLSVIAYRQPVLKADVEAIRGVSCGELIRQLLDRGLVRIAGRSDELGSPFLYATTKRFLEVFGLANLDALPRSDTLRAPGLPDWRLSTDLSTEISQETPRNPLDEPASSPQNQTLAQSSHPADHGIHNANDPREERTQ